MIITYTYTPPPLLQNQVELMVGILSVISAFGALIAGQMSDQVGRRGTVLAANIVFLAGGALMAFANGYALLFVGRVVTGLGVGMAMAVGPVYSAELSPAHMRGALVSFSEISMNLGVLLGYVFSLAFYDLPLNLGWRLMLGLGGLLPICMMIALIWMPESPRYLVQKGRLAEAKVILGKAYMSAEVDDTLDLLQNETKSELSIKQQWQRLAMPTLRRMLMVGLGMAFFQQASGCDAAVYYVSRAWGMGMG